MSGVNKVILVGRLGVDPELRNTTTGHQVCTLSLATSESWTKDGNKEEKTEWHRVVLWDRQAELAHKYLKKGRLVYLEGKLQTRSWQDQQGQKRYTTEIIANNMQFIDGGNSNRIGGDSSGENHSPNETSSDSGYYSGGNTYDSQLRGGASSGQASGGSMSHGMDDDIPF